MDDLQGLLAKLDTDEADFVLARSKADSIKAALDAVGVSSSAFYKRYGKERRAELEALAERVRLDRAVAAEMQLRAAAVQAVSKLVNLLNAGDERVQFQAAKLIVERVMGKTPQSVDVTSDGMPVKVLAGLPDLAAAWGDGDE
jgi:outer membrane protein TolC